MDKNIVYSIAKTKIQILIDTFHKKDLTAICDISSLNKVISEILSEILQTPVSIAPRTMNNFFQVYHGNQKYHIRFLSNTDDNLEKIIHSLSFAIVISCCPPDFVDSIDPHTLDLQFFYEEHPALFQLVTQLQDVCSDKIR